MMIVLLLFDLSPRAPLWVEMKYSNIVLLYYIVYTETTRDCRLWLRMRRRDRCVPLLCLSIDDGADCASDENAGMKKKKKKVMPNNDWR